MCALIWAHSVVLYRKSGDHLSPLVLNAFKSTIGLILFAATMVITDRPFFPNDKTFADWAVVVASGIVGIGLADTLFFRGLNIVGASRMAIVDTLYSPSVMLCSFLYLHEPLRPTFFLALCLLLLAILIGLYEPGAPPMRGRGLLGAFYGASAVFLTASAIVFVKPVLDKADVLWVSTLRLAAGSAVLLIHLVTSASLRPLRKALLHKKTWLIALPASFLGTYLGFLFWMMGMKYTYTTVAAILNQTSSILTLPISALFLKERLGPRQWLAIFLGFLGASIVLAR